MPPLVFSTAASFQRSVEIHVLQGERPMARDNKTIGKFQLNGIKLAPAGVPQIEVTFDIDANGILKVSARDLDTGREQSITITANDRMSDAEINNAIRDAEQYASQDKVRRDAITVHSEANIQANRTEYALRKVRRQISKEEKREIKASVAVLRKLLVKTAPENYSAAQISDIRSAMKQLENVSFNMMRMAENAPEPGPDDDGQDDDD